MSIEIAFRNEHCIWVDVLEPTEEDLAYLHERYEINSLLLEDTVDANHLPKYEQDGEVKFFLLRENTELDRKTLNTISDVSTKLGIFVVDKLIITVHRLKTRSVATMREDVERKHPDATPEDIALGLALCVLNTYDEVSTKLVETLDKVENEIFLKTTNDKLQIRRMYKLKRKAGLNTRILNLSADWVGNFRRLKLSEAEIVNLQDRYKDVVSDFDHLNAQITNLISMQIALSDQRANQVMKLLAIYSVYFLPITFIAGLYGMNFDNMPELHHKHGYFYTLGLMALIVLVTFIYFRKKKW